MLELGETTLWFELVGLNRRLQAGDTFPAPLHFTIGALATIEVTVAPDQYAPVASFIGG